MSKTDGHRTTERESREVAEGARQKGWEHPSFGRGIFSGRLRLDLLHPHPEPEAEDERRTEEFIGELDEFLREKVDPEEIERTGKVPEEVIAGLAELGAFGIKIGREYGGLGLSQLGYSRAIGLVATHSAAVTALLSAHQSIGVPQPLKLFGTAEQKQKWLPRLARGAVSAFALTEPDVGSDPARMKTSATPTGDGEAYLINGEKLWCTNGPIAELAVVMARTPTEDGRGAITAFVIETDTPGLEIAHRSEFMGLRGIENGVLRFSDVRVPKENVIGGEGQGLKIALTTLNIGRLTIPATVVASAKWCLGVSRRWASERAQWGRPIGEHEAVAHKLSEMAATTFAMEAISELTSMMADSGEFDIRIEAALAKLWSTERAWRIADDTMQIRGGRGYETAESLRRRGEEPLQVEQVLRDTRINTIFEGSSEVMRLLIAREAVDEHLSAAGELIDPGLSAREKLAALPEIAGHYAAWYPRRWIGWEGEDYGEFGELARHLRFIERASLRLSRATFHAMLRHGPKLERRQATLFRLVDIGAELFAMSAACVRARWLLDRDPTERGPEQLAGLFCRLSHRRVDALFSSLYRNDDARSVEASRQILAGEHTWLEASLAGSDPAERTSTPVA